VDAWYDEISDCDSFPGCPSSGMVGHFTAMVWAGATHMACTISDANPGLAACRYGGGPGSTLSNDTPNMGGAYEDNVLGPYNDEEDCADGLESADPYNTEIPE